MLKNVKIGAKIYCVVGFMAIVAVVVAALSIDVLRTYMGIVGKMQNAAGRAVLGERADSLINSVVMNSAASICRITGPRRKNSPSR